MSYSASNTFKIAVQSICFVFAVTILGTWGSTSVGAASGGLGGRPTNPDPNNSRSSSIFIYTLDKGQARSDSVTVVNNTDQKQVVSLYAVDATTSNTGAFTCKQDAESRSNVGNWITFSESTLELEAGSRKDIPFNVNVPQGTDIGEHNGCLVIQPKDNDGEMINGNVRIRTRSAIRVAVTVPGDLQRDVTIENFGVSQTRDAQEYVLKLKNTGNVSADVLTSVSLRTLFGGAVFKDGGGYPTIADKSLELRFANSKLPYWGGWYFVGASISYDKQAGTFGTTGAGGTATKYAKNNIVFITPQTGALIVYALVFAALIVATILFRRQHTFANKWGNHTVKAEETIESIAKSRNVTWRKVARANNLKAPYTLEIGSVIKVPARKKKV